MPGKALKRCSHCRQVKSVEEFTRHKSNKDGLSCYCRPCKRVMAKKYNKQPRVVRQIRDRQLQRAYGITLEDYNLLYDQQKGMCALCGKTGKRFGLRDGLHVDHNHKTNRVRGLLCNTCNRGMGLLQDNPVILERAVEYLRFSDAW